MRQDSEAWTSRDGATLTIRPIAGSDFAIEKAFIEGLSFETGYSRLLSARKPEAAEIARFTHLDPAREMAWVGVSVSESDEIGTLCGVARYVRDGDVAEWAIVVADAWQGRGLGEKLLRKLIDSARATGIGTLSDITFATNRGMIALARKLGFAVAHEAGDATLDRLTLPL